LARQCPVLDPAGTPRNAVPTDAQWTDELRFCQEWGYLVNPSVFDFRTVEGADLWDRVPVLPQQPQLPELMGRLVLEMYNDGSINQSWRPYTGEQDLT
jgi:hypothetical protein